MFRILKKLGLIIAVTCLVTISIFKASACLEQDPYDGGGLDGGLYVPTESVTAAVHVFDPAGNRVPGATVTLSSDSGATISGQTDRLGSCLLRLRLEDYAYLGIDDLGKCVTLDVVWDNCHESFSKEYRVPDEDSSMIINQTVTLKEFSNFALSGIVTQRVNGRGLPGTAVTVWEGESMIATDTTNTNGRFYMRILRAGTYSVTVNPPLGWISHIDLTPLVVPGVCLVPSDGDVRDYQMIRISPFR